MRGNQPLFQTLCLGVLLGSVLTTPAATGQERTEAPGAGRVVVLETLALESPTAPPISREVLDRARSNQLELEARGVLDSTRTANRPFFIWPLRQSREHLDHGYSATISFVDHDPRFPDSLLDYNGGVRTYDLDSGYNHQGSDFIAWPFGWVKVALNQVEVVAAAAGTIVLKIDGNFDRECAAGFDEQREANLVVVAHQDGSIASYGHLKKGSLTTKEVGAAVEQGEYLGVVASSGFSGYPHLHFEIYDSSEDLIDPFAGPHNSMNAESWWAEQPTYWDPGLLTITTHSEPPTGGQCKSAERTHVARRFAPGDDVYLAAYVRDLPRKSRVKFTVLDPDGEVFAEGRFDRLPDRYVIAGLLHRIALPAGAKPGRWTYRVKLKGTRLEGSFEVGEFEPDISVRSVRPKRLRAGTRRKVKIKGTGFPPGMAADIQSQGAIEKNIEIRRARIKQRRIVLTVDVASAASPGSRDLVLTAPDYTQLVVEDGLRITEGSQGD